MFVLVKPFNSLTVQKEMSGKVTGTTKPEKTCSTQGHCQFPTRRKCHEGQGLWNRWTLRSKNSQFHLYLGEFSMAGLPLFIVFPDQLDKEKTKTKQSKSWNQYYSKNLNTNQNKNWDFMRLTWGEEKNKKRQGKIRDLIAAILRGPNLDHSWCCCLRCSCSTHYKTGVFFF